MLKFVTVRKTFGNILALDDVNLDITPGEFVFVAGPSGAGKSTLLNLILRKYLPDAGEIFYNDQDITKLKGGDISKLRQNIGTIFQDFKVLRERTIAENIEVALAVRGVPDREWAERIEKVLALVGLPGRADDFPSQLSGGEIQRVAIARALATGPDLILADEPTGNLDWETANSIMDLFDNVNKEGKTVIVATHHQGITQKMRRRMVLMRGGKIESDSGRKDNTVSAKPAEKGAKQGVKVEVTEVKENE